MAGKRRRRGVVVAVTVMLTVVGTPAWAGSPVPPGPWPAGGIWQPVSGLLPFGGHDYRPSVPYRPEGGPRHSHGRHTARAAAEARVLAAVNRQRRRYGCRPLKRRAALVRAARAHSADMARHRRLSHLGSDGSTPGSRVRRAGYRPVRTAETLTVGPASPESAVRTWMHSPPHRAAILMCSLNRAGAGVVRGHGGPWWTLVMASGR